MDTGIVISAQVREAIAAGKPVVALESTIFTHGLPRPRNMSVALEGEQLIRDGGAVPATIGVVDGVPTVGLSGEQIEQLSFADNVVKVSIRDLPIAVAKGLNGGTTVAATSFLARQAGIAVFATGGLGGVHRGASETFDESADMTALARIPIVLVSAGVKSILDIGATLERFETLNLPVLGYQTKKYPGFYLTDSGHEVTYQADSPAEVAAIYQANQELGLQAAVLLANPVAPELQLDPAEHEAVLQQAWEQLGKQEIIGHDATPFLLDYIQRATAGRSLDVNVAVYRGNITLACQVAGEICR